MKRLHPLPTGALILLLSCAWSVVAHAADASRPRVGLVLSGGGARGAAHVGVLKVLDEMRVPIDAIAGTSMGAVVGGLYASGMSAQEIETLIGSVNWQDAFRDRPPRAELGYRRKQDDRNFLVRYALGVREDGFVLPQGLVQGQKLEQVLRSAALPVAGIRNFDRLPVPFRAVATPIADLVGPGLHPGQERPADHPAEDDQDGRGEQPAADLPAEVRPLVAGQIPLLPQPPDRPPLAQRRPDPEQEQSRRE